MGVYASHLIEVGLFGDVGAREEADGYAGGESEGPGQQGERRGELLAVAGPGLEQEVVEVAVGRLGVLCLLPRVQIVEIGRPTQMGLDRDELFEIGVGPLDP
jgi:hypothetical protein